MPKGHPPEPSTLTRRDGPAPLPSGSPWPRPHRSVGGEAACAEVQAAAPTGGPGNDVAMGNQLATGETINALNFDSYFSMSEILTLGFETGYAHFAGYKTSTWGPQFTHRVQDVFKASPASR